MAIQSVLATADLSIFLMHITFKPALNKLEFVATFNWLEMGDRSPKEFQRHISTFTSSLTRTANDHDVRLTVTAS